MTILSDTQKFFEAIEKNDINEAHNVFQNKTDAQIAETALAILSNNQRTSNSDQIIMTVIEKKDEQFQKLFNEILSSSFNIDDKTRITKIFFENDLEQAKKFLSSTSNKSALIKLFSAKKGGEVYKECLQILCENLDTKTANEQLLGALQNKNWDLATLLIQKGADVNANKLLHHALFNLKDLEIAKFIIESGCDLQVKDTYGFTPLHLAIRLGDKDLIKLLIEKGADVNAVEYVGWSPIFFAICDKNLNLVKLLCENGADLNLIEMDGRTPFLYALHTRAYAAAKILIEKGCDLQIKDKDGNTPLHLAIRSKDKELIKLLIEKGADINSSNDKSETPLIKAISEADAETAKILIEKGCDLQISDKDGNTPLHHASRSGNKDLIKLLIEKGADINSSNEKGETPLITAISYRSIEAAQMLIEKECDLQVRDKDGNTPLHYASQMHKDEFIRTHDRLIKLLIEKGADINSSNEKGETPLILAISEEDAETAKILIEKGCNLNTKTAAGEIPIIKAIHMSMEPIAEMLIEKGCDLQVKGTDGDTPLHYAIRSRNKDLIKLLIEKGVDINCSNNKGETPLFTAISYGSIEAVQMLVEKGCNLNTKTVAGEIPVIQALRMMKPIVKTLIEKGCDLQARDTDGDTPLHWAIRINDKDLIELLVEKGADVNAVNAEGQNLLYVTHILLKDFEMVKFLIAHGADVNKPCAFGQPPLCFAAGGGNKAMVEFLLACKGIDVNVKTSKGITALMIGARDFDITKLLIDKGANVNAISDDGTTAVLNAALYGSESLKLLINAGAQIYPKDLLVAITFGNSESAKLLIESGVDINHVDETGRTALYIAIEKKQKEIAALLIEKNCNVNIYPKDENPCISAAIHADLPEIAKLLIQKDADLTTLDKEGIAPIHLASRRNQQGVLELILDKKCDINLPSATGETCLHYANHKLFEFLVSKGANINAINHEGKPTFFDKMWWTTVVTLDFVKFIISHGADVKAVDENGKNVLFELCNGPAMLEGMKLLIENGADMHAKTKSNRTLLHQAAERGKSTYIKFLVENGLDVNAKDKEGKTPLHLAAAHEETECLKVLLELKADINAQNEKGETPLHVCESQECAETLIIAGADLHILSDEDLYPLQQVQIKIRPRHPIFYNSERTHSSNPFYELIITGRIGEMAEIASKMSSDEINRAIVDLKTKYPDLSTDVLEETINYKLNPEHYKLGRTIDVAKEIDAFPDVSTEEFKQVSKDLMEFFNTKALMDDMYVIKQEGMDKSLKEKMKENIQYVLATIEEGKPETRYGGARTMPDDPNERALWFQRQKKALRYIRDEMKAMDDIQKMNGIFIEFSDAGKHCSTRHKSECMKQYRLQKYGVQLNLDSIDEMTYSQLAANRYATVEQLVFDKYNDIHYLNFYISLLAGKFGIEEEVTDEPFKDRYVTPEIAEQEFLERHQVANILRSQWVQINDQRTSEIKYDEFMDWMKNKYAQNYNKKFYDDLLEKVPKDDREKAAKFLEPYQIEMKDAKTSLATLIGYLSDFNKLESFIKGNKIPLEIRIADAVKRMSEKDLAQARSKQGVTTNEELVAKLEREKQTKLAEIENMTPEELDKAIEKAGVETKEQLIKTLNRPLNLLKIRTQLSPEEAIKRYLTEEDVGRFLKEYKVEPQHEQTPEEAIREHQAKEYLENEVFELTRKGRRVRRSAMRTYLEDIKVVERK